MGAPDAGVPPLISATLTCFKLASSLAVLQRAIASAFFQRVAHGLRTLPPLAFGQSAAPTS